MKFCYKVTMWMLIVIMLALSIGFLSAMASSDTGIWEQRAYIDEFDFPTDDYYISNKDAV